MPAYKLAETAKRNAELLRDFEASIEDEERHRKTATTAPKDKLGNLPLTRERFKDWARLNWTTKMGLKMGYKDN